MPGSADIAPEDDFGIPDPPPPPGSASSAAAEEEKPRGTPPPQALVDLGNPPDDPLACQEYMYRACVVLIRDTMLDGTLTNAERRREVSRLMETAKSLVPTAKIFEAIEEIRRDRAALESRRRKPTLEPVPPEHANPR